MNKKILVITWFYPPVNSSEGLVTYKLLKASKYEYDVFTQKNSALWSYDNTTKLPQSENVKSIYAKATNLLDWQEEAINYYKKNKNKYDIVMTRSMPPESHKIGIEIKKINPKIKWIASFGDPIAENPYTKMSITYASPFSINNCTSLKQILSPKRITQSTLFKIRYRRLHKYFKKQDSPLQHSVIKNADYLIFNNEYQKKYMLKQYDNKIEEKALVLNHSYDNELYPKKKTENKKIKFTYVGHLDTYRNPFILFSAIRDLHMKDPKLADKVEFEFYGNMSDQDKLFIINYELTDVIKIKKPVSYLKSLEIMKNSDWLLQLDANISSIIDKNIFFAAKLADYIGTGNNIFGITMLEGISADILRNLNAIVTSYSSEEVKNYLWLIIYKNYKINIDENFRKQFDSKEVSKKFDELIEKIK